MGVRRLYLWAALALSAWLSFAGAGPASARPLELASATCTAGADSAEAAFAVPESRLKCGAGRFEKRSRFVRARARLDGLGPLPPDRMIWQTAPTSFESMLIRLDYADGMQRLIDVDAQMTIRNWDANGNFWVPISQEAAPLLAIDVVVERPQSPQVLSRMSLSSFEESSQLNYKRTLFYVLLCGTLLMPTIYDLFFYRVLRARFMIWHLAMTAGTLLYTLFKSGLVMVLLPDIPSFTRYAGVYLATSLTILGSTRFSLLVGEEGSVSARVAKVLNLSVLVNCAIAVLIALRIEALRMWVVQAYFLSILPIIAVTIVALAIALRRKSRAAVFLLVAYAGLILAGLVQVLAILGVFPRTVFLDEAIYVGLVVVVIGTSAGVGDRFLVIKSERDRARLTAKKLGAMANTDGLTGLLNRRAFDQTRRLERGRALLLADIDRFKAVNDTYGHQRGDAVLCHAARVIETVVEQRGGGEVYRLGGEEFAILTQPCTEEEMRATAEAVRDSVERSGEREGGFDMPDITISIGGVMGEGQLMHVAFSDADGALYRAKENGRNRCEFQAEER